MPLSHLTPSHLISCCFPSCEGFSPTSIPVTPELPTGRTRFCSGPAHHRYFGFCGWHFVSMNRSWKTDASIYTQNCLGAWCNSNKSCITDFQMKDPPTPTPGAVTANHSSLFLWSASPGPLVIPPAILRVST